MVKGKVVQWAELVAPVEYWTRQSHVDAALKSAKKYGNSFWLKEKLNRKEEAS